MILKMSIIFFIVISILLSIFWKLCGIDTIKENLLKFVGALGLVLLGIIFLYFQYFVFK